MNKSVSYIIFVICLFFYMQIFSSCQKENTTVSAGKDIEWMKVLDESVSGSTEEDAILGQNGKVITDADDNIYLYYYSALFKKTVVMKCDSKGIPVWKKSFDNCIPMDMVLKSDGSLALAVRDLPGFLSLILVIYEIRTDGSVITHQIIQTPSGGSFGLLNSNMYALPDNNIVISGVYLANFLVGFPIEHVGYYLMLNSAYDTTWNIISSINSSINLPNDAVLEQNSIVPLSNGKFLTQMSYKGNRSQLDSLPYGYATALLDTDSSRADASYQYPTGYEIQSTGAYGGYYNRYSNGLIPEAGGGAVHHYSAPESPLPGALFNSRIQNGFIRIGEDAKIKDTIPLQLPQGYRIMSCVKNNNNFLMTACKVGSISATGDFRANQTLFLYGNSNSWQVSRTFNFQEFYSDFFPSSAPTSDGGFIIMGKIQSFNGPQNKLILIKWKDL